MREDSPLAPDRQMWCESGVAPIPAAHRAAESHAAGPSRIWGFHIPKVEFVKSCPKGESIAFAKRQATAAQ